MLPPIPLAVPPSETRTARGSAGFTLVELLVVIGIIALLISILLPSLNRARKSAQNVQCMSNLRTLGQAYIMYADANRGVTLATYSDNAPGHTANDGAWFTLINPYLGKTALASSTTNTMRNVSQYIRCPIGRANEKYGKAPVYSWDAIDYGLMDYSVNPGTIIAWKKTTSLRPADKWAIFFDYVYLPGDSGAIFYGPGTTARFRTHVKDPNRYSLIYRHDENKTRGVNTVFADGHVAFVATRAAAGATAVPDDATAYKMFGDLRPGPLNAGYQFTN
jgi:prepilin-type N-terminal cleavage/methylation domain-containing protein/prepilin-type processing-associated H-X9-DG protein